MAKHPESLLSRLAAHVDAQDRPLRVLFYGQSITKQEWWEPVVERMRAEYPDTPIVAENLAIGGFAAQRLIVTTPRDVRLFRPDLVVFHVFGAHHDYERIHHYLRTRTAAEVVIANDHLKRGKDPAAEDEGWGAFMNGRFLPAVAEAYGIRLVDVRGQWRRHLLDHHLESGDLLRDGVHLNQAGNELMARIIGAELIDQPHDRELIAPQAETLLRPGEEISFDADGVLTLPFTGARIDAIVDPEISATFVVELDGKPVSAQAGLYEASRPLDREQDWPWQTGGPVRIRFDEAPREGRFTIEFIEGDMEKATFRVTSQDTGDEGRGTTEEPFLSRSGRISILPEDWWRNAKGPDPEPVKPGVKLHYEWRLCGTDELRSGSGHPAQATLFSGLPNTAHELTLRCVQGDPAALKALRVIRPPLPADSPDDRVARRVDPHDGGTSEDLPDFIFSPL